MSYKKTEYRRSENYTNAKFVSTFARVCVCLCAHDFLTPNTYQSLCAKHQWHPHPVKFSTHQEKQEQQVVFLLAQEKIACTVEQNSAYPFQLCIQIKKVVSLLAHLYKEALSVFA